MVESESQVALPGAAWDTTTPTADDEQENPHVSYQVGDSEEAGRTQQGWNTSTARRPARLLRPLPNLSRPLPATVTSGVSRTTARLAPFSGEARRVLEARLLSETVTKESATLPDSILPDTPALPIADAPPEVDRTTAVSVRRRSSTGSVVDPFPLQRRSSTGSYDVISTEGKQLASLKGGPKALVEKVEGQANTKGEDSSKRRSAAKESEEESQSWDRRGSATSTKSDDSANSIVSTAWYEERKRARRSSIGETSRSRWAKANWYALERAGSGTAERGEDENEEGQSQQQPLHIATMVNVIMFAMHWRQRALGEEAQAQLEAGSPFPDTVRQKRLRTVRVVRQKVEVVWSYLRWLLTLYIILAWDINVLADPTGTADRVLHGISTVALFLFAIDLVARLAAGELHILSPEALVDLLSLISLLPETVHFLSSRSLLGPAARGFGNGYAEGYQYWPSGVRALRAGFRISRGVGMISLLLLQEEEEKAAAKVPEDLKRQMDQTPAKQSRRVINTLVDIQTAGLAMAFLAIYYGVRFVLLSHSHEQDAGLASILTLLCRQHAVGAVGDGGLGLTMHALEERSEQVAMAVLYLVLGGEEMLGGEELLVGLREYPPAVWRFEQRAKGFEDGDQECVMYVDGTDQLEKEAKASLVLSVGVVIAMLGVTRSIRTQLDREVLVPLEQMEKRVISMLRNPLRHRTPATNQQHVRESLVVENAVHKFTSLLRVSLGEAGGRIVTANLSAGSIDRNLPGKIVHAIFGFCDIRNFTDLTELLQADIVKLVNTVALCVHTAVTDNYGAPNKNIGDAFLLVWKPNKGKQVQEVGDSALRSILHTILAMKSSEELTRVARRKDIQQRLPGYHVHLGFGLHYGWAVEGAIGSSQKIDASYLSPHVNLSSRLESATKQYGVPLLVSESMRKLLSVGVQRVLRLVDRVVVKGSATPIKLYTYDAWALGEGLGSFTGSQKKEEGRVVGNGIDLAKLNVTSFFAVVPPSSTEEYRTEFLVAMDAYLGGDNGVSANWQTARVLLQLCITKCPQDGAAKAILEFIDEHCQADGMQPAGWCGYRRLEAK